MWNVPVPGPVAAVSLKGLEILGSQILFQNLGQDAASCGRDPQHWHALPPPSRSFMQDVNEAAGRANYRCMQCDGSANCPKVIETSLARTAKDARILAAYRRNSNENPSTGIMLCSQDVPSSAPGLPVPERLISNSVMLCPSLHDSYEDQPSTLLKDSTFASIIHIGRKTP